MPVVSWVNSRITKTFELYFSFNQDILTTVIIHYFNVCYNLLTVCTVQWPVKTQNALIPVYSATKNKWDF